MEEKMKKIQLPTFNVAQREGIAKSTDSLAVASLLTLAAAATDHGTFQNLEIWGLIITPLILFVISFYLRRN
jgi:hypothetical protein